MVSMAFKRSACHERWYACIRDVKLATLLPNTGPEAVFLSDTGAYMHNASMELQRAAEDSTGGKQTLDGLMMDSRGNFGGLLMSAVDVSSSW